MVERERDVNAPVIGVILLATDLTTEADIRALVPGEVRICATRIPFENPTVPSRLRETLPHLGPAAALLVPGVKLSALYFSCTSASTTLGEDVVVTAIAAGRSGVPAITPIGAAKRALKALDVTRVAVMTPYVSETTDVIVDHLGANGLTVTGQYSMEMEDDRDMAELGGEAILDACRKAISPDAEVMFISCTALPAARHVPMLERELGVPVVTSNLAGIWLSLRTAGVCGPNPEHGALFGLKMGREAA